jgi:hypothetical protein
MSATVSEGDMFLEVPFNSYESVIAEVSLHFFPNTDRVGRAVAISGGFRIALRKAEATF